MDRPIIIGIYVVRFPAWSETFIVAKILRLLDAGLDVHVFADTPSEDWDMFGDLALRPGIRDRIHLALPTRPLWKILLIGFPRAIWVAFKHPVKFAKLLKHCWQGYRQSLRGFLVAMYTRLHFVGRTLDILHIEFDTQGYSIADIKAFLGCKLILSSRMPFHMIHRAEKVLVMRAKLFGMADGYHFVSESLRQEAIAQGMSEAILSRVIYPGVDTSLFSPRNKRLPSEARIFHVVSIGRLVWQKGYARNLEAIHYLKGFGIPVRYTIVGGGPEEPAIKLKAEQYGLIGDGTVDLMGATTHEEVIRVLSRADVLLHLAYYEGLSNVALEAQAIEVPVITSGVDGQLEAIVDGVTGFVVPDGDPALAADRLLYLYNDTDLRARMGKAGRQRVLSMFSQDRQIDAFLRFYDELLAGSDS